MTGVGAQVFNSPKGEFSFFPLSAFSFQLFCFPRPTNQPSNQSSYLTQSRVGFFRFQLSLTTLPPYHLKTKSSYRWLLQKNLSFLTSKCLIVHYTYSYKDLCLLLQKTGLLLLLFQRSLLQWIIRQE